jgi:hypothetical protein
MLKEVEFGLKKGTPRPKTKTCLDAPQPWQWSFQSPATSQMEGIYSLYSDTMSILTGISIFVLYVLAGCLYIWKWAKFKFVVSPEIRNFLVAQRPFLAYTHHTKLEIV